MAEIQERRRTRLREQHRHEKRLQQLRVHSVQLMGSQFIRVVFDGGLEAIDSHGFDDVLVLFFPVAVNPGTVPTQQKNEPGYVTREYSVRYLDPKNNRVTVDFLMHERGVATSWARSARRGQMLWCVPPRMCKGFAQAPSTYLFADPSAFPAVNRFHREAGSTPGHTVLIGLQPSKEKLASSSLRGITVFDKTVPVDALVLASGLADRDRSQTSFIWIAGEANWAGDLRRLLIQDYGVSKEDIQFTGYWKSELNLW